MSKRPRLLALAAVSVLVVLVVALVVLFDRTTGPDRTSGTATGTGTGYLSTSGTQIVDEDGAVVRLTGVNWFGNETESRTFDGLWSEQGYREQIDQMASLGYNTLRVPWSNDILEPDSTPQNINPASNAELVGMSSLEVLDAVIEHAGSRGMRVVLDRHRPSSSGQSVLWYTDEVPEKQWIEDWQAMAQRYAGNPVVVGADLHNEPRADGSLATPTGACWGCEDPARDWRLAAERAGNAVHEVNPDLLIVVEGVSCPSGGIPGPGETDPVQGEDPCGWWGGNLSQAGRFPVRLDVPDKLVYSPHDYGMSVFAEQPWFLDDAFPTTLEPFWRQQWGYLVEDDVAPVLLGEFGSTLDDPKDGVWMPHLLGYLDELGASFTYWSWNPNSGDTGGIVQDDWTTVETAKQEILDPHLVPPVPGAP